ncbi:uncharacterized protein LOC111395025 [Olea europaea subsp. europaea]|uniref:Pepsin-retropepsin like protein n=1 Tax=Olea europaea subsp. europaea TaxID=158383 RepID=A0A385A1M9_OLEEU|nr:pepsin-retropepsin like protein [Olea europaea subsp. europaea]CAA2998901.1 uncharacterized protein LOC111395025 [Olea europaea subsp. europaea]
MSEYERKFDQLSRYASHLVDTEDKKVRRIEQGLNSDISMILMSHSFTTYREMLERAYTIWYQKTSAEQHCQLFNQPDNGNMGKRKWNGQDKGKGKWQNKKANGGASASKSMVPIIAPCSKCGRTHRGECLQGKNVCFRCGKPGHIIRDCPTHTQKKDDNSDQNQKGKARVFALTQQDAEENSNVIEGTLLIANTPAYVLFDSGTTHSFASTTFMAKSSITCDKSEGTLEVSIPSGNPLNTDRIVKSVSIEVEGKPMEANLYMIEMKDFDIILGMDWLGCNYATIRCKEMEVSFQKPGEEPFLFLGMKTKPLIRLVSALQAEKMLRKETCQGYLVSISGGKQETITVEDVCFQKIYLVFYPIDKWNSPQT